MNWLKGRKWLVGVGFVLLLSLAAFLVACQGAVGPVGPAGPAGTQGVEGPPGPLPPGVERQVSANITVSKPANGTHFAAGEQPVLTITLKDQVGKGFNRAEDFSQLRLMLAGPQETTETVTAVKLLKTSDNRSQPIHHYIDLKTNPDVQASGTTLTYKLGAVSDEKPGTYIASVWAVEKAAPLQQAMVVAEFQIGTPTAETQIVEKEKCASCHLGADSGKFYFAHIDVGLSPVGNPALDQNAVRNCKTCHNNDGYSAYADPTKPGTRVVDQIVKRVHGIHMGEELKNPVNTDPKTGIFKDYTGVIFPNNVRNCTSCHVDDRWKTKPSRLACGACHDNVWFGEAASMPKTAEAHPGGPQANDSGCATCHPADTGGVKPIAEAHKYSQKMNKIDVSLTAPRRGNYYVAGEKPVLTLVIRDDNDKPIDHTSVNATTFSTANFYVYGPRLNSVPVLTNTAKNGNSKARASVSSTIPASGTPTKGWVFDAGDTFKIAVNGGPVQQIAAPEGLQTPNDVVAWLRANIKDVTITANAAGNINLLSNIQGGSSRFEIYNSPVTTKMGWKALGRDITREGKVVGQTAGVTMEPYVIIGNVSTAAVDMRLPTDPLNYTDPNVSRNAASITYPLDDVA
ncbi:MAG: hypothetical protein HY663_04740, partial [Chloroflexi bacterium]|nr:hypothetical protein [Chloroflexota bacterium]